MAKGHNVSSSVIRRLPRYYRFLEELLKKGVIQISSRELSEIMGLTASQIRQDLNCFGGFGQQGYGYNVEYLQSEIGKILGVNSQLKTILIGFGNLGRAIANHISFESRGFSLVGIFEKKPELFGDKVKDVSVSDVAGLDEFCRQHRPTVAVLCISRDSVQEMADQLVNLGLRAFWNFSHYDLAVDYENIVVENVHMGDSLMTLGYRVNELLSEDKREKTEQ